MLETSRSDENLENFENWAANLGNLGGGGRDIPLFFLLGFNVRNEQVG